MYNAVNSEPWHIDKPGIFRNLTYLKPEKYAKPSQGLIWSILQKKLKAIIVFPNCSILDLGQGSEYAHLSSTHLLAEWPRGMCCSIVLDGFWVRIRRITIQKVLQNTEKHVIPLISLG